MYHTKCNTVTPNFNTSHATVFLIFNEEDLNMTKSDSNMLPVQQLIEHTPSKSCADGIYNTTGCLTYNL